MHRMKPAMVAATALMLALVSSAGISLAGKETATDLFRATATTGVGQPLPVDIDPANIRVRDDGAIGLGYTYKAEGKATGKVSGDVSYEEHGYLFFMNPADPTTFAGSAFASGVFTLDPKKPGPTITIADTCPSCYSSGVETVRLTDLPHGVMKSIGRVIDKHSGSLPKGGSLTYGYFTFTNEHGTFTGYSTPDSREFAIEVTFTR